MLAYSTDNETKKVSNNILKIWRWCCFCDAQHINSSMYLNVLVSALLPFLYQSYDPDHVFRPPTLPPKPQRMRKSRPRSIFNRKLFNGNMEAFIQVRACLCSLSVSASSAVSLAVLGKSLTFAWLSLSLLAMATRRFTVPKGQGEVEKKGITWLLEAVLFRNSGTVTEPPPPADTEFIWLCKCQLANDRLG